MTIHITAIALINIDIKKEGKKLPSFFIGKSNKTPGYVGGIGEL